MNIIVFNKDGSLQEHSDGSALVASGEARWATPQEAENYKQFIAGAPHRHPMNTTTEKPVGHTPTPINAHRWNIEQTQDGLRICRGEHKKDNPCEWEYYTRSEAVSEKLNAHAELVAALTTLLDVSLAFTAENEPMRFACEKANEALAKLTT